MHKQHQQHVDDRDFEDLAGNWEKMLVKCEVCGRTWDTVSPCASCYASSFVNRDWLIYDAR